MKFMVVCAILLGPFLGYSQSIDEEQPGAWYMYFVNKRFEGSRFGVQGDYQFRFWNLGGDLEQMLLRT